MKTIVIHIGGHKTGSTAIQKMLFQNRELLKEKGWLFPGPVHAHNTIGVELKNCGGYNGYIEPEVFLEKSPFTKQIFDEIRETEKDKIIISAEIFEYFTRSAISTIKSSIDSLIEGERTYSIIYYCRRQDYLLESLYRETIKQKFLEGTGECTTFSQFISVCPLRNYSNVLDSWATVFGKENIILQPYEKGQYHNIFSDFFKKIDLELTDEFAFPSDEISNIGLSADLTEFLRLLSKSANLDQAFRNKIFRNLVKLNITGDHARKMEYFSPKDRQNILAQCEKTNQKVAREYLGRDDGKLFYEPVPESDTHDDSYKGLTIINLIPILTWILYQMTLEFTDNMKRLRK